MVSIDGQLLIASPYLSDRNFFRSVVLLISHDSEHAFGLLLNRPGHNPLGHAWEDMTGHPCIRDEMIRTGGPLDGPMMMLHQLSEFSDSKIVTGVHLSTVQESVELVIDADDPSPIIPIVGYSGWGAGQLESELEIGGWMTLPATPEVVFADPDELWNLASSHVSDSILAGVDLPHVPQDPRWN